jgi:hypothetical protein
MDGVILIAIIIPAVIAMFTFLMQLVNNHAGTKGISKDPYTTKSGVVHTAKKSRENHIV